MAALDRSDPPVDLGNFVEPDAFRSAMRHFASGVTLITAGEGAGRRGLTATAVCSLSAAPPSLLVCVNRDAESFAAIQNQRSFCVNMVAAEHQSLAKRFSGQDGVRGIERFSKGNWTTLVTGAPVLADALAAFDCDVLDIIQRETHAIFIGGVRAVHMSENQTALVYRAGRYHTLTDMPHLG